MTAPAGAPAAAELRVSRIGSDGDGVGHLPDGIVVYLPGTLPGETVLAHPQFKRGDGWAGTADLLATSDDRAAPPCPHFGPCGGCALQHWRDDSYLAWKTALLETALRRAGYGEMPAPAIRTPPGARRRVDLAIRRQGPALLLGLHGKRSADIVDLHACPVLHPDLFALIAPLRTLLRGLGGLRRHGSAILNLLDSGPDLLLRTDAALTTADRTKLAAFAQAHGLPRITAAIGDGPHESAALLRPPTTAMSGITVTPPPGAFLQASAEGEAAIIAAVLAGLPKLAGKARIAELYAGCGTLTFALAKQARAAPGGEQLRPRRPGRGAPPRPDAPAAVGQGTGRLRRRGAGPAAWRRGHPGGADRGQRRGAHHLCQLQPGHAGARREAVPRCRLQAAGGDPDRPVPVVAAAGERDGLRALNGANH